MPEVALEDLIDAGTVASEARVTELIEDALAADPAGPAGIYVGRNAIGGTFLNMAGVGYAKRITITEAGLLASIDAYVKGNSTNGASLFPFVLSDNAGAALRAIASGVAVDFGSTVLTYSDFIDGNGRWISKPIGAWLEPGSYWIGMAGGHSNGGTQLAYDATGGGDAINGAAYATDHSLSNMVIGTNNFSIRGLFIVGQRYESDAVGIGSGFPVSPASGDRFYRTDRHLHYFYDGTRWLTVQQYRMPCATLGPTSSGASAYVPIDPAYKMWIEKLNAAFYSSALSGGSYWSVDVGKETAAEVITALGSVDCASGANTTWISKSATINAEVDPAVTPLLSVALVKHGSPGAGYGPSEIVYRLVG